MLPIGQQLALPLHTPQKCPANITIAITTTLTIIKTIIIQRFPAHDELGNCRTCLVSPEHELNIQGCDCSTGSVMMRLCCK